MAFAGVRGTIRTKPWRFSSSSSTTTISSAPWVLLFGNVVPSPSPRPSRCRLFGSHPKDDHDHTTRTRTQQQHRADVLSPQLVALDINATALATASYEALTTTNGYDVRYGKSAIKCYRSYLKSTSRASGDLLIDATRTARQIDFLIKRHRSREAAWVRHTDNVVDNDDDDDSSTNTTLHPLVLLLDNVRSAANVGSLFRTADAAGCREVITTGLTPHPSGGGREKLAKSALGAERTVTSRHFATTREALETLRREAGSCNSTASQGQLVMVGLETTSRSRCYTDVTYDSDGTTVLVLGNEVSGVDTEIMDLLDVVVEIPMFGRKNSLNVAACAPVVMYEVLRQWGALEENKTTTNSSNEEEGGVEE